MTWTSALHGRARAILLFLLIGLVTDPALAQTRREATGWLQLEQDQTAYRERIAPLDLRQRRQLDAVERQQRLEQRALQQRQARERRLPRPDPGPTLDAPRQIPPGDHRADWRRASERLRLQQEIRRSQLPFGRR
ncbi:hypothetical protein F2Q65_07240 [Thiohalocapsa marina]|uniref:Uncharacterized protein n=1 Tax=Thiohalocapsa marina TaxID=424902 RepID=A0A5M8FLR3_9GAMM|nr:hypothetical protein [Thiohalocapsa marina]KAA6185788.1 hypothetical protein F2Q65_07240 [Thiohalocapsa marina]